MPGTTKKKKSRFWKRLAYSALFFILLLFFSLGIAFYYLYTEATPSISDLRSKKLAQTSIIYDRTGKHVLYELYGEENRKIIPADEIPLTIRAATIAVEDKSFYSHKGIDISAIIRAINQDIRNKKFSQGGSTITQQLARSLFFSREKTLKRKVLEIVMAIKIERSFSKDEILEMYLNTIPYGSNAYGIEAAAQTFFGKRGRELTLDEAALLASLPQAPSYYSPYRDNRKHLLARQKRVLDSIENLNLAPKEDLDAARHADVIQKLMPLQRNILSPHFVFYAKEELAKIFGNELIETGGYRIYTTLDYDKQLLGEKVVRDGTIRNKSYGASNAALVSLDPKTGEILAMVGSKDYFDTANDGEVNVTIRPRQPGSSFKPFVYAASFEKGFQPENLVYDVPTDFGPDGSGKNYIPKNYDGQSHGLLTLREALAMSLNIPAVKVLYLTGINDAIDMAERLGISTLKDRKRYGLSLVLGGGDVTLLDETAGFGVFANDGEKAAVHSIARITDSDQNIIMDHRNSASQVIDNQIARKINSILSDNKARSRIFGSNSKLIIPGITVAAKTGTTQEFRDAWTVGYTPSLVTGVWVGNNDNRPMKSGADGVFVAAPIWNAFMSEALKDRTPEKFADYERAENKILADSPAPVAQIKYYNNKTGKFVSEKKAKKTDPKKIEVRVQYAMAQPTDGFPLNIEMRSSDDPVIQGWRGSIEKSILEKLADEKK